MPLFKHSDGPFIYLLLGAWYLADIVGLSTRDWALGVAAVLYFGILGGVAGHLLMAARSKVGVVGVLLLVVGAHIGATMIGAHRFVPLNLEGLALPPGAMPDISRQSPSPRP
jgi:hypothetical protein